MKYILLILLPFLLCGSCFEYDDVDFNGISNIRVDKIEGRRVDLSLTVKVDNPNSYKIKVKPSNVQLYVDDKLLGTASLDKKVVFEKKVEQEYRLTLHIDSENGALLRLAGFALRKQVTIHIKGKVKGSIYGITHKIDIDEKKTIDGSMLKLKLPFN
jgi:LEA14-like dessication related protein